MEAVEQVGSPRSGVVVEWERFDLKSSSTACVKVGLSDPTETAKLLPVACCSKPPGFPEAQAWEGALPVAAVAGRRVEQMQQALRR